MRKDNMVQVKHLIMLVRARLASVCKRNVIYELKGNTYKQTRELLSCLRLIRTLLRIFIRLHVISLETF
ncbi:hypothetical protein HanIR_Chr16g0833941 [Helianthus annuus]|nr:hypothetical protein HanIR_Chr16g0833941 [Helianthus annuus]